MAGASMAPALGILSSTRTTMKYALIFLLLVAIEAIYIKVARRAGIVDRPSAVKSHRSVVVRGGGIVFVLAAFAAMIFCGVSYPWFFAGLAIVATVSFADDIHSLPYPFRLIVQFAAMALMLCQLSMASPMSWTAMGIIMIVGTGILNAYNFMDGVNGITAAYSLALIAPLAWLNMQYHYVAMPLLATTASGVVAFAIFNFRRRALCFTGDVGSIGIAFILLFALILLIRTTGDISYITLMAVYGVDSVLTIVHRIMLGENIGQPHRKHAYQLMANELHIPQLAVTSAYAVAQAIISAGLLLLPRQTHILYMCAVVALLSLAYVLFMKKFYRLHASYIENRSNTHSNSQTKQ